MDTDSSRTPGAAALTGAVRACRSHLVAAGAFSFFLNLLYLTVPVYSLQVYDRILPSGSASTLLFLSGAAAVALAVLAALDGIRANVLARAGVRLERRLAPLALEAAVERALAHGPAERGQGLRDIETLRQALSGPAVTALLDLPWIPLYVGALFLGHWTLGVLASAAGVILVALAIANDRATRAAMHAAQGAGTAGDRIVDAALRNAETLRAMGMLATLKARWDRERRDVVAAQLAGSDRGALFGAAIRFVRIASQVAILGTAAYLAIRQEVTPGTIFAAAILLARAIQPVEQMVGSWRHVAAARGAYARLARMLDSAPRSVAALELPRPTGQLSLRAVTFVPPGAVHPALLDVSFELPAGEALGVIGPTAAGKSTLARLVAGVYPPSAGEVRIDGADAFTWARGTLGRHVGYLAQDVQLFPGTVAENIARFGPADDEAIVAAARAAGAHDQILALPRGYATPVDEHGASLSGGQRQLIGLARALYGGPALVVLDEPNANLDSLAEAQLADCIRRLKSARTTVVVISHRVSALAAVDRILCLQHGRVVASGPRQEIMSRLSRLATPPESVRAGGA